MTPFVYGKVATDDNFIDREKETRLLASGFSSLINQILISPRRWGKSSLVRHAAQIAASQDEKLRFVFVDMFNVRSEGEFIEKLSTEVFKQTASLADEILQNVRKFAGSIVPMVSLGSPDGQLSLSLKYDRPTTDYGELLDLPEKIAKEKGQKIVVCIDEFQQLGYFKDPRSFQALLRGHWQYHQNVSYCLYGSRRHMMTTVFGDKSMPFYKFGNLMFLQKIETKYWIEYIQERFAKTGKTISQPQSSLIVALAGNNPYYVQQLSQMAWFYTNSSCTEELIRVAFEDIVAQQDEVNKQLLQTLSTNQQQLLKAIVHGEKRLSSYSVLQRYGLKSSADVANARKALESRDIIDLSSEGITFQDPLFEFWLKKNLF